MTKEPDCDVVSPNEISAWREKLRVRFGIGEGKLRPLDDPDPIRNLKKGKDQ